MPTYAVGDVQGCYEPLQCLLQRVGFNPRRDRLWFVGDLVNRGPKSLEVLRFARSLGDSARIVLGNHDLNLLAMAYGQREAKGKDTLDQILAAPDRDQLIDWLRHQPLIHKDDELGYAMVHAGIPPVWSFKQARHLAGEVEAALQAKKPGNFLGAMYGNDPLRWNNKLRGQERLRSITNYLTRMRFCTADGELDFEESDCRVSSRPGFLPWFEYDNKALGHRQILFGHWAALEGESSRKHIHALDTGCVWGARLRLMCLDTGRYHHCDCRDQFAGNHH